MTLTLYQLSDQYRHAIADNVDPDTGEIMAPDAQDFLARLGEIRESIGDKAENIGKLCLELQGESKAVAAEADRLGRAKNRLDQKAQWLRDYLLQELDVAGLPEITRPAIKIAIRTNPPSVNVLELDAIPELYKRLIPASYEADKKKIVDHYKETKETVSGVEIVEKRRVDIR